MTVVICRPGAPHGVEVHRDVDRQTAARLVRAIPRWNPKGTREYAQWVFEVYDEQGIVAASDLEVRP